MVKSITHKFASAKGDGVDATLVQPSNWNDEHVITSAEGTVVAASSVDISASSSLFQSLTGNTTITSFAAGGSALYRKMRVTGTPLITYDAATLITPTGQNIQAAAGDCFEVVTDGDGNARIINYTPFGGVVASAVTGISVTSSLTQLTSISLTPGKWRITGNVGYDGTAGTATLGEACIGTTTASNAGTVAGQSDVYFAVSTANSVGSCAFSGFDVTLTANTTYFLNARFNSGATDLLDGSVRAERIF